MRFLIFLLNAGFVLAQGAAEDQAVRDVVRKYVEARELRDPKAVEALFTQDADQLVSSGEWRRGRDAVVRGTMASSQATGGKRTITAKPFDGSLRHSPWWMGDTRSRDSATAVNGACGLRC